MEIEVCPCGSEKSYQQCCEPIINLKVKAQNPEELMRARYSSYVKSQISFIEYSMHPSTRDTFVHSNAKEWAENSEWVNLEIINTKRIDEQNGEVEFKAFYKFEGKDVVHHELSKFKKEDDEWFFYDYKIINSPIKNEEPKIGRNQLCPCKSGKKYKKCCGKK